MLKRLARFALLAGLVGVLSFIPATSALAQAEATTGVVEGTVDDQSGSVIPGATVTLAQTETGFERVVISDDAGRFRARLLPVGIYLMKVEQTGFKTFEQNFRLTVGSVYTVRVTLQIGDISETVTVMAGVDIDTSSSLTQNAVGEKAIDDLPINGRDFQSFVYLTPGTVGAGRNTVSISGGKGIETNFNIDGVDRNNPFFGGQSGGDRPPFTFSQEAVREFVVLKDGYSAEFGRASAGIVNVVTKSGTNDWHGGIFYLFQDGSFINDTITRRVASDGSVTEVRGTAEGSRRHQFGGNFGGPIAKDKAFFFFSTEHQDFVRPIFVRFNLSSAERAVAPQQLLDQEGQYSGSDDAHVYLGKFDWLANDSNNISLRYTYTKSEQVNGTNGQTSSFSIDNNGLELDKTNQFVGSWNSVITPRLVNEFRFNWVKEDRPRLANVNDATAEVRFGGGTTGGTFFLPIPEVDDRYQVVENMAYNFGAHDVKFGVEFNDTGVDQVFRGNFRGSYRFDDIFELNAGTPSAYLQFFGPGDFVARVQEWALFIQDDWRATRNLTINLGLRWEGQYNPVNDRPNPDFPAYAKKIADDTNNFGPRIGFAWDPQGNGKTVIRGSGGIFFARTPMLLFSNPLRVNGDVNNGATLFFGGSNVPAPVPGGEGFPGFTRAFQSIEEGSAFLGGLGLPASGTIPGAVVNLHALDFQNPESYRFTGGIEHQLHADWVFGFSYTHARTIHRELRRDTNLFPGTPDAEGRIIYNTSSRPIPFAGDIALVDSSSFSNYNAVTFSLKKRFADHFLLQAHYTVGDNKSVEDNERDANTQHPVDPMNIDAEYGRSSLDIRQNFTFNAVVELPWDFQLSSIITANSGTPFNATTGTDNNRDGNFNDRPFIGGSMVDRNAFEQPTFSNVDLRITKKFVFTDTAFASAFIELFNLFDNHNFIVTETRFGRTEFGLPLGQGGDPFSLQLGVRFDF